MGKESRNRLFSVFQVKRSKITSTPPVIFARPKVIKDVDNKQPKPERDPRIPNLEFQNHQNLNLRMMKSLPSSQANQNCLHTMPSSCAVVSVATQTEPYEVEHRKLRRVGTAEKNYVTKQWVSEAHSGDRELSEAHSDDREVSEAHSDDREVSEALSRGCQALQEAIQYRQRANIYF